MTVSSVVLNELDYRTFPKDFLEVRKLTNSEMVGNLGNTWRRFLEDCQDKVDYVSKIVTRGDSFYVVVGNSKTYFDFYEWLRGVLRVEMDLPLNPFTYSSMFGVGNESRDIKEVLYELNSLRGVSPTESLIEGDDYSPTAIMDDTEEESSYYEVIVGSSRAKLEEGQTLTLGRSKRSDVVLVGRGISNNHFSLQYSNGRLLIKDNNSTNGTFVDKHRIGSGWVVVTPSSLIKVGGELVELRYKEY